MDVRTSQTTIMKNEYKKDFYFRSSVYVKKIKKDGTLIVTYVDGGEDTYKPLAEVRGWLGVEMDNEFSYSISTATYYKYRKQFKKNK